MANKKGLHKDVSVIFDGIPLPKNRISRGLSQAAATSSIGYTPQSPAEKPLITRFPNVNENLNSQNKNNIKISKNKIKVIPTKVKSKKLFLSSNSSAKQRTMFVLIPILFTILILLLSKNLSSSTITKLTAENSKIQTASNLSHDKIDWALPKLYPDKIRDPMGKLKRKISAFTQDNLVVKGIVYSKDNPAAIIGIQIFHEGDSIDDTQIAKINKDSVEFYNNKERWIQKVEK